MKYSANGIRTRTVSSFSRLLQFECLISRLNVDCSEARSSRLLQIEAVALTTPSESHCSINDARWKILPSLFPPRRGNFISWSPGGGCYLSPIFDQPPVTTPPPAPSSRYRIQDTALNLNAHVGPRRALKERDLGGPLFTKLQRYMYANGETCRMNFVLHQNYEWSTSDFWRNWANAAEFGGISKDYIRKLQWNRKEISKDRYVQWNTVTSQIRINWKLWKV